MHILLRMQSWASFEPPKTTVKRVLLHEDRNRSAFLDKKDVTSLVLEGSAVAPPDRYTTSSTLLYPSEEEGKPQLEWTK